MQRPFGLAAQMPSLVHPPPSTVPAQSPAGAGAEHCASLGRCWAGTRPASPALDEPFPELPVETPPLPELPVEAPPLPELPVEAPPLDPLLGPSALDKVPPSPLLGSLATTPPQAASVNDARTAETVPRWSSLMTRRRATVVPPVRWAFSRDRACRIEPRPDTPAMAGEGNVSP
jgi:hypothetical protein